MPGEAAQQFYEEFMSHLQQQYKGDMIQGKGVILHVLCSVSFCIDNNVCYSELLSVTWLTFAESKHINKIKVEQNRKVKKSK